MTLAYQVSELMRLFVFDSRYKSEIYIKNIFHLEKKQI